MKPNTYVARPKLGVHDYSRSIFKLKPKIRIIHIVEPEIIKTTVEDFQELVQRLTGKRSRDKASPLTLQPKPYISKPVSKIESISPPLLQEPQRMKIEVEDLYDEVNQTALTNFLEDVDGFFQDMNEFPLLSFRPSHFNIFGEMPLC